MSSAPDSTLFTYTACDGENLAVQYWPLAADVAERGTILLVHGLGEHAGRYDRLARRLNDWGFAVAGYDQYGHGESAGERGTLPTASRLVDDLADLVDSMRARHHPWQPLILFGHSLGALVASVLVARRVRMVDALVLSSPVFDPGLSTFQKLLLRLATLGPNVTVANGLDPADLSRDPEVVDAYKFDGLVHDRVSGRLARFIAQEGPWVVSQAPRWTAPTLLMYSGCDRVVDSTGSRHFAAAAPKDVVSSHCFEHLYHEIFNEPDAEPAYECLQQWLDARF